MKTIKSLIKKRRKFLAENHIQDWNDLDTISVADEYAKGWKENLLLDFVNYYKRVHNDGIWDDAHVVKSYLIQSTKKPK